MERKEHLKPFAFFAAIVAMIGSFLFGFQTAVISGALRFISEQFHLSLAQQGFLVSILLLGALVGVMLSGVIADALGRKKALILPSVLFCIGAAACALSTSFTYLLIGRLLTGLSVGIVSMTVPLYLAEITTSCLRGRFVAMHQLLITAGILSAYLVNYHYNASGLWHNMFLIALIPSFLQLVALPFVVESPSWLLSKGQRELAYTSFSKLRLDNHWQQSLVSLASFAKGDERKGIFSLFSFPKIRFVIFLGILLNMFQQITGINTLIYYAPKIFEMAGLDGPSDSSLATIGIGAINVLATFLSVTLIEKMGRRLLLMISLIGMFVCMQLLALQALLSDISSPMTAVIALTAFVASFAIGMGPVTVVLVSELYPMKIRGRAMSIATCSNWLFNYVMSFIFLDLLGLLKIGGVFQLYAALCILTILFVYFYIPETKGKSLEEIEASLH